MFGSYRGPTGVGDDWVRIGPIKMYMDGGMLNGTAYMRQPWPKGETYQITEDGDRGLLFIPQEQLRVVVEEALDDPGPVLHPAARNDSAMTAASVAANGPACRATMSVRGGRSPRGHDDVTMYRAR